MKDVLRAGRRAQSVVQFGVVGGLEIARREVGEPLTSRRYLAQDAFESMNPKDGRLLFNTSLSGVKEDSLKQPQATIIFYDESSWSDGKRIVAFADGSVRRAPQAQWHKLCGAQRSPKSYLP